MCCPSRCGFSFFRYTPISFNWGCRPMYSFWGRSCCYSPYDIAIGAGFVAGYGIMRLIDGYI